MTTDQKKKRFTELWAEHDADIRAHIAGLLAEAGLSDKQLGARCAEASAQARRVFVAADPLPTDAEAFRAVAFAAAKRAVDRATPHPDEGNVAEQGARL